MEFFYSLERKRSVFDSLEFFYQDRFLFLCDEIGFFPEGIYIIEEKLDI